MIFLVVLIPKYKHIKSSPLKTLNKNICLNSMSSKLLRIVCASFFFKARFYKDKSTGNLSVHLSSFPTWPQNLCDVTTPPHQGSCSTKIISDFPVAQLPELPLTSLCHLSPAVPSSVKFSQSPHMFSYFSSLLAELFS